MANDNDIVCQRADADKQLRCNVDVNDDDDYLRDDLNSLTQKSQKSQTDAV